MGSPYTDPKISGIAGAKTIMPDNGQVERMNRTIKDATVRRYHYDDHAQFERHLADFSKHPPKATG